MIYSKKIYTIDMEYKQLWISQKGQSVVEYILLLAVIMVIVLTVFKAPFFKDFFSQEGKIFARFRLQWEHSYRHCFSGMEEFNPNFQARYSGVHPSMNRNRFFYTLRYPK